MKVQTQTEEVRRLRRTNLELIFSDHNAYCLPPCQNKCPSHIDIPGFLKANAEANWRESDPDLQADDPVPVACSGASARRRARSTAGATRSTRRSPSATATATPATRSSRRCSTRTSTRRCRSSARRATGRRAAVIGSGPAGMAAAYYLLLAGHDVTVFERDPAPGGMLRYGIPQYRLPKVEVLEAEYESVDPARRQDGRATPGLGRDFTLDDLTNQGFDAVVVAIGCYDTNKLGIPGEDAAEVLDGLEYLRTATLGLPYPDHAGKRVVVIGGGFTSMDCSRTSVRQGASRGDARLPPRHEGHAGLERGPRGDRGRRHRHLPGRPGAGRHRRRRARSPASSSSGWRSASPTRPAAAARSPRPAPSSSIPCDRVLLAIGQGPDLDLDRARAPTGPRRPSSAGSRPTRSRSRPAGPGVFGTGDVRIGAATVVQAIAEGRRSAYAVDAFLQGPRPGRDPDPPDARRAAARVPLDRAVHQRGQGAALPDDGAWRPRSATTTTSSTSCRTPARTRSPNRPAACSAPARRSASATCAASGIEYGTTLQTLEPQYHQGAGYRSVTENRFTGVNHDYIRDDSHAFILREPSRCIDCGRCAQVCSEVVGAACYDFMRIGFDTLVTTPLDMSLNDTPCVSCGRCAETCPTGALMPKPRVLQKYEVDESRCILCGICVDACPYDALRDGADIELAHTSRAEPMIDLMAIAADRPRDRGHLHPARARLGGARRGRGPAASTPARMLPMLPPTVAGAARPATATGTATGTATAHGHGGGTAAARPAATSRRPMLRQLVPILLGAGGRSASSRPSPP